MAMARFECQGTADPWFFSSSVKSIDRPVVCAFVSWIYRQIKREAGVLARDMPAQVHISNGILRWAFESGKGYAFWSIINMEKEKKRKI